MLGELLHATIGVTLLSVVVAAIYIGFTDLPLAPFILGEIIGFPLGVTLLTFSAPRRQG